MLGERPVYENIIMLIGCGHRVDIVCKIEQEVDRDLLDMGVGVHQVNFSRSPIDKSNIKAYQQIKKIILFEKYDIVHTHTPIASVVVRLVCRKIKDTKVFYTAHGFHFFKGAPLKNWIIYYPIEKYLSRYTDTLITINQEDYNRANKSFKAKRIRYMPGVGMDFKKISLSSSPRQNQLSELGIPKESFIVLSVGELNENKNHETIIKALKKISIPNIHYVICGEGNLESYLKKKSEELGMDNNIHLLGFRTDILEWCMSADIFAFPSLREGLGMAALEAMSCGLPLVTSNVHGIVDYSKEGKTGYLCNPLDVDCMAESIKKLYQDKEMREKFGEYNKMAVQKYNIDACLSILSEIYTDSTSILM